MVTHKLLNDAERHLLQMARNQEDWEVGCPSCNARAGEPCVYTIRPDVNGTPMHRTHGARAIARAHAKWRRDSESEESA